MKQINLYIHVPFCKIKCSYCAFYSLCGQESKIEEYFSQLRKEILSYGKDLNQFEIKSIYFGGGTPNLVDSKYVVEIIKVLKRFKFKDVEVTVECNPEFVSKEKLDEYRKVGVNRISMGVQSFDEDVLRTLGRKWNMDVRQDDYFDFIKNKIEIIKESGFSNFNLDLIFAIPGQSVESWEDSLNKAISLEPKHLSIYSLSIDEGSVMDKLSKMGAFKKANEDLDRQMYRLGRKILSENGYEQYEISNFCQRGFECRHNLDFWRGQDYLGFGAGAGSFYRKRARTNNDLSKYLKGNWKDEVGEMNEEEIDLSLIMRRIRLIKEGLNLKLVKNKYLDKLKILEKKGLVKISKNKAFLTDLGMDLENKIMEELY